jgi:hypothetical protein
LQIGTIRIDSARPGQIQPLDISFSITKSTRREPNTAEIKIWNLSPNHRGELDDADSVQVSLNAGYKEGTSLIFSGDLNEVESIRDGVDFVTTLEGSDGGATYRSATIQQSFARGTAVSTVLRAAVAALGIGDGNLAQLGTIELTEGGSVYPEGTVLSGPARSAVDRIVRSCGLNWSIQNGNLQIRRGRNPVESRAIVLHPATGLIGSPSKNARDGRRPPTISAESLLIPGMYPARKIVLESDAISGQFQIKKITSVGNTAGNDWKHQLELEEY